MAYRDFREFLAALEAAGKLRRVQAEVDKDWELSCITRWMFQALPPRERYAILFERVKDCSMPVVVGATGASPEVYAIGLGTTPDGIREKWMQAMANPLLPVEVTSGPVKDVVLGADQVDLTRWPVPVWTPGKDGGPYLTAGCVITRDPDTGGQNIGTYRIQVKDKNRTGILIEPFQHIGFHYAKYQARGEDMPVAVVLGAIPAVAMTSVTKIAYGLDEMAVAGGLNGEPVPVVKGETVDLMVPAYAECVIEGVVPAAIKEEEGPFGEWTGYVGKKGMRPIINVQCITHRRNPILHTFLSQMPPSESSMVRMIGFANSFYRTLVHDLKERGIIDVHFWESSGAGPQVVIKMRPQQPFHSKRVLLQASHLLDATRGKMVIVVDEDIDISDESHVNWAISLRVNPQEDIVIIPNTPAMGLDPSVHYTRVTDSRHFDHNLYVGSKILIDATIKRNYPDIALPPKAEMYQVLQRWPQYGLPPINEPGKTRLMLNSHPGPKQFIEPFAPY